MANVLCSVNSVCTKVYQKIPVIIRSLIIGLLILCSATFPLLFLIAQNMNWLPQIPWVLVPGILFLWLYWRYLNGHGWPAKTSNVRKEYLRANAIPSTLRMNCWISGIFLGLFITGLNVLGYLLLEIPKDGIASFQPLLNTPLHTGLPLMLFFALVVGVSEEAAFRGYMQKSLEKRYTPTVAIGFVAIIFALVHFPPMPLIPFFVLGAVGWGVLAYFSNSILPGIIFHIMVDLGFLLWLRLDTDTVLYIFAHSPSDGINNLLIGAILFTITIGCITFYSFFKLGQKRKSVSNIS